MKKNKLKIFIVAVLILGFTSPDRVLAKGIGLNIDGRDVESGSYIDKGRTLVPLRIIGEELGMNVSWNGARREVTIVDGESKLVLAIGSKSAFKDGLEIPLEVPAAIKSSTTYVPIRFIADAFSRDIFWDSGARVVSISSSGNRAQAGGRKYLGFQKDPDMEKIREAILKGETLVDVNIKDRKNFLARFVREYSYLAYIDRGVSYTLNSKGETLSMDLKMGKEDFRKLEMAEKKADEIVRTLDLNGSGVSDLEKIKRIHDYLINNAQYAVNSTHPNVYTAYGALIEGKAVCAGYSKAFQQIAHKAGLETVYVSGIADNGGGYESHAWNKVKLDGDWYNIDVTWDDPVSSKPMLTYDYFLKADRELPMHKPGNKVAYPEAVKVKDFTKSFK